eukprot:scaffold60793_cov128-Phaeocystis_antarctica.AAC.1
MATDPIATIDIPCLCSGECSSGRRRKLSHVSGGDLCEYPGAINYWSAAVNYGFPLSWSECVYAVSGCTDSGASNYLANANTDNGGCTFPIFGCTDATAINFNSAATVNEGCIYTVSG